MKRHVWPASRSRWMRYYVERFNRWGKESSAAMAMFYLFLLEEEKYEALEMLADSLHWPEK